jgi:hypothetical protein
MASGREIETPLALVWKKNNAAPIVAKFVTDFPEVEALAKQESRRRRPCSRIPARSAYP